MLTLVVEVRKGLTSSFSVAIESHARLLNNVTS
jgi:hypothetical protein